MDPARFDLNLLRALDALLLAHGVTGAARRLGLSQPATSAALARLRRALRDPLLVRTGNRMTLTPLAQELAPRVARLLEEADGMLRAAGAFDPATTKRSFRIGASDYATLALLVPLTTQLRRCAPGAVLEILPLEGRPALALASRELDLAVADAWTLRGIRGIEPLFHERFVSIARARHPRLGRKVTLERFLAEEHALISPRGIAAGVVDDALASLGRSRRIAVTVPHYLVAPAIVAGTDLVMTLPRRIVERFAHPSGLRLFEPPLRLKGFDVAMAHDPRSSADPSIQWLKTQLRQVAIGQAGA